MATYLIKRHQPGYYFVLRTQPGSSTGVPAASTQREQDGRWATRRLPNGPIEKQENPGLDTDAENVRAVLARFLGVELDAVSGP
ncbi:hypothetical protein [Actinomadura flavalba]|uniref:hypothetical protein n=1 Tax=Actinomadura flavalba TaxID=1120938 RepID=UPI0003646AE5|nr:hypothetical protein [Actinomadura flavalba]